ncbi:hypothetical protein DOY81_001917 [Sarcophaga bullata]|nr:hypothetical protein DOY81_001917 [Sarcophaga bullata]
MFHLELTQFLKPATSGGGVRKHEQEEMYGMLTTDVTNASLTL